MTTDSFIHLRKVCNNDRPVHSALARGSMLRLAPQIAFDAAAFERAPLHRQLELRARAASLSTRKAVLIGKSAARVHGLWVIADKDEPVELALPSGKLPAATQIPEGWKYYAFALASEDYRMFEGVRVVSRARACIDIARVWGFVEGLVAMDSALRSGLEHKHLWRQLEVMGRIKGVDVVRRCVRSASALSQSAFESFSRGLILDAEIPELTSLTPQFPVPGGYFADLGLNGFLLLEIDGQVKYDGKTFGKDIDEVLLAEREREKALLNMGYQVLRYSPRQLIREPEMIIADIRTRLAHPPSVIPPGIEIDDWRLR